MKKLKDELKTQMDAYFFKYDLTDENGYLICSILLHPKFKKLTFIPTNDEFSTYQSFVNILTGKKFKKSLN